MSPSFSFFCFLSFLLKLKWVLTLYRQYVVKTMEKVIQKLITERATSKWGPNSSPLNITYGKESCYWIQMKQEKIDRFCKKILKLNISCYQPKQQRKSWSCMVKAIWEKLDLWESGLLGSLLSQIPSVPLGVSPVPELIHLESEGKAHLPQTDAARLSLYLQRSEALGWREVSISGILFLHTCYLQWTVGTHTDFYITRRRQTCFLPRSHCLYIGKQLKSRKQCWCCSYRKVFTPRPSLWWLAS